MSAERALYNTIVKVLQEHDGCCLDNAEEVNKVAEALTSRLKLWTTREVADFLGVSHNTARRWRGEGKGPQWVELDGGLIRYSVQDVRNYVKMRRNR